MISAARWAASCALSVKRSNRIISGILLSHCMVAIITKSALANHKYPVREMLDSFHHCTENL
jgi:hypothetical protein